MPPAITLSQSASAPAPAVFAERPAGPLRGEAWWTFAGVAAALVAGLVLRLWNLRDQVLGGDELHAVRAVDSLDVVTILRRYPVTDYSLPLTALLRLARDLGLTLTEMHFRAPALIAGLLVIVVLPALGRRAGMSAPAVVAWAWLLALSPDLVLYSRIARSYLPMVLLCLLAAAAFAAAWQRRSWRLGWLYAALGGAAIWVHLGSGPAVAAPWLWGFVLALKPHPERRRRLLFVVGLGAALTLVTAALIAPAARSLLALVALKHQPGELGPEAPIAVAKLYAGTAHGAVAVLFWIAAGVGLLRLARRHYWVAGLTLTVALGHVGGILALSPFAMNLPLALNRYLLPILPLCLLWVASLVAWPAERWTRRGAATSEREGAAGGSAFGRAARLLANAALVGLPLALAAAGPYLGFPFRSGSFAHHNAFVDFASPPAPLPAGTLPALYRQLPDGPVVEAPWAGGWANGLAYPLYQREHRRPVLVTTPPATRRGSWLSLRNEVASEPAALLRSRAGSVVVHLRPGSEEDRVRAAAPSAGRMLRPEVRQQLRREAQALAAELRRAWGPPDWSADDGTVALAAWDLERLRRQSSSQAPLGLSRAVTTAPSRAPR